MNTQDIKTLLDLQKVLTVHGLDGYDENLLAALLDWKNGHTPTPAPAVPSQVTDPDPEPVAAKTSRAKAKSAPTDDEAPADPPGTDTDF